MNYLGIEASVRNLPELDRDFFPLYKFNHAFLASAKKPLGVAVERSGGEMAAADFRARWDWEMTPQQRADMLANVALEREMKAYIDAASDAAAKPPVDPVEFAGRIAAARMERARRM